MKIIVKAVNRVFPDNIGDYLWESLQVAAKELDIELIRVPTKNWYHDAVHLDISAREEVRWINNANADAFLFFSNWIGGSKYRTVAQQYGAIQCPVIYISREDPNHFKIFSTDTQFVNIIGTSCSDCILRYKAMRPNIPVINLPMAVAPDIFYPSIEEPEFDIVFLGNRYRNRLVRNTGEKAIIFAAADWAKKNNKKMAIYGYNYGGFGWQDSTLANIARPRVDRLKAADIYRNAKVALSVASNDWSPTMCPNRVPLIAATGIPLIAYTSPAVEWITGGNANISKSAEETKKILDGILLDDLQIYTVKARLAKERILAKHTFKNRLQTILEALDALSL